MTIELRDSYDDVQFLDLYTKIEGLKLSKEEGWQEKAAKLIHKSRLDVPDLELKRLRSFHILDLNSESEIDKAIKGLGHYQEAKRNELKIMVARAMEIQKIYSETHHVFIHAQSTSWLLFPDLVKEFMKANHPEQDVHQFKFLRMPNLTRPYDIQRYTNKWSVFDHETQAREDLISADAYFYNNRSYESALDFMSRNRNILGGPSISCLREVIRFFHPELSLEEADSYAKDLIEHQKKVTSKVGNLFVICIPKEKSEQIQYRAHPFGTPCHCDSKMSSIEILESLQKGSLNTSIECEEGASPQYRIFTPALKKEDGVKVYLLTNDRISRKKSKEKVRNVVKQVLEESRRRKISL